MAVSFRGFDYYIYPAKNPDCYGHLFRTKTLFHVLSDRMKSGLIASGVSEENIFKITPAIHTEQFKYRKNFILTSPFQLLTIARLHWHKGHSYTLEALALLKKNGIDFHYTIIGEGAEREKLTFTIHQLGLENHVTLTGKISHEKVYDALLNCSLYIQYSSEEGFCNALIEAQSTGAICLASDADGLLENISDGNSGYIIPKRNPEALFEKIIQVINTSREDLLRMSSNATERASAQFDINLQRKKFREFYKLESDHEN
jgi:colanic acid/amylovoran biosynthesis glycosyltransferase